MRWRHKYMIQKSLSLLPFGFGVAANRWLSRRFGGLREPTAFGIRNTHAMCCLLDRYGFKVEDKVFVELGTGWDAAAALALASMGAGAIHSYDLFRHLDEKFVLRAKAEVDGFSDREMSGFPFECDIARVAGTSRRRPSSLDSFHYYAPHDARDTGLTEESVDCYFSLAVLEHIPKTTIEGLLRESWRILKQGGLCFHYVQPTMHAAWADPTATGIDYLTCSDFSWRALYDNSIAHENRLRAVEYVGLIKDAEFDILGTWRQVDKRALEALPRMRIAARFRHFSSEELATSYVWILARKS